MVKNFIIVFLIALFLSGCMMTESLVKQNPAKVGSSTRVEHELVSLPDPSEKIVAAVYKFRDQSGQYQTSATGVSWSTAVTQGATSVLIKALEESGWFVVIEREGLSNLLNERKIIRSSRANFKGADGQELAPLPPLLYAGVIFEGGIISYDKNILTGGAGAKYFGLGASTQYRQDKVTIYLRAVSTQNGRILKTVYTTKTILSEVVDVGFYRYVEYKRLFEAEAGYSYNEPVQICVTEAIQKAVRSLIIEGVVDNLWQLKNPRDVNSLAFDAYFREKEDARNEPLLAEYLPSKRNRVGLGINLLNTLYTGDYPDPQFKLGGNIYLDTGISKNFTLSFGAGKGMLAAESNFNTDIYMADFAVKYHFFPQFNFSPLVRAGTSLFYFDAKDKNGINNTSREDRIRPLISMGSGFDYLISDMVGINLQINYNYTFTDLLDGIKYGNRNDQYWDGQFGIIFYLTKN